MKKLIFISLAIIALMTVSCTTDYSDPANISGTTWRCSTFTDQEMSSRIEYIELRFTSKTTVETWMKYKNEAVVNVSSETFVLVDKLLTLTDSKGSITKATVTFEGKNMTFIEEGQTTSTMVFTKQ